MKSKELTEKALKEIVEDIQNRRSAVTSMFMSFLPNINKDMRFDFFIHCYTGIDAMRLEVVRDMILNGWIFINEDGCIEIGTIPKEACDADES